RGRALAAGDVEAQLRARIAKTFLERAAHGRREAARMPVESQHAAESLEPVWIGEAPQDLVAAEFRRDVRDDLARKRHHALEEIARRLSAVQRQVGESGARHGPAGLGAFDARERLADRSGVTRPHEARELRAIAQEYE